MLKGLHERDRQRANNGGTSTFALPPVQSTSRIRTTSSIPSFSDALPPPTNLPPAQLQRRPAKSEPCSIPRPINTRPATSGPPSWLLQSTPFSSVSNCIPLTRLPSPEEDLRENHKGSDSNAAARELNLWSTTLFRNSDPPPLPLTFASSNYDILNLLSPHLLGLDRGDGDGRDRGLRNSSGPAAGGSVPETQEAFDLHPSLLSIYSPSCPFTRTTSPSLDLSDTPQHSHSHASSPTFSEFPPLTIDVNISTMQRANSLPKIAIRNRRLSSNTSRRSSMNSASPNDRISSDGQSEERNALLPEDRLLSGSNSIGESESPRDVEESEDVEEKRRRNTAASGMSILSSALT